MGRPRNSLELISRIARSASSFVASSTKQYDGFLPEKGSIDMLMCSLSYVSAETITTTQMKVYIR